MTKLSRTRTRRSRLAVLVLAVAVCLIGPVPAADAATEVYHQTVRGVSVSGDSFVTDGCTTTYRYLFSSKDTTHYQSWSYNRCTSEGEFLYGEAVPDVFRVAGRLGSVRVVATIPLIDSNTGESAGAIEVDQTFRATSPAVTTTERDSERIPGDYLFRYRFTGMVREADANGTLGPLENETIRSVRSGVLRITYG